MNSGTTMSPTTNMQMLTFQFCRGKLPIFKRTPVNLKIRKLPEFELSANFKTNNFKNECFGGSGDLIISEVALRECSVSFTVSFQRLSLVGGELSVGELERARNIRLEKPAL